MVDGNNNGSSRDNEDDDGGDEGTLSEAREMIIKEVRSLSVSTNRQIITID